MPKVSTFPTVNARPAASRYTTKAAIIASRLLFSCSCSIFMALPVRHLIVIMKRPEITFRKQSNNHISARNFLKVRRFHQNLTYRKFMHNKHLRSLTGCSLEEQSLTREKKIYRAKGLQEKTPSPGNTGTKKASLLRFWTGTYLCFNSYECLKNLLC